MKILLKIFFKSENNLFFNKMYRPQVTATLSYKFSISSLFSIKKKPLDKKQYFF